MLWRIQKIFFSVKLILIIPKLFFPLNYQKESAWFRYLKVWMTSKKNFQSSFDLRQILSLTVRSSHSKVFYQKGVFSNFAIFTGKHLCPSLLHRCFPVNIAKFLRKSFFIEHLWWLLLNCPNPNGVKLITRWWFFIYLLRRIIKFFYELL